MSKMKRPAARLDARDADRGNARARLCADPAARARARCSRRACTGNARTGNPAPAPAGGSQAIGGQVAIPGFWDPKRRPERPDMSRITVIRFTTEVDYPPFNYAGPDGNPIGFNIDLARLICEELKVQCTVQMRRFDTLLTSLAENRGDAAMASIVVTPDMRRLADFSDPYYRTPARFAGAARLGDQRRAAGAARGQGDRGGRRHRARGVPQEPVHRS